VATPLSSAHPTPSRADRIEPADGPDVWVERRPYPVDDPPDLADGTGLRDYELAASQGLTDLRDTRRGAPDRAYVTYHWVLSFYGEYALAGLLESSRQALTGLDLDFVPADRLHLPLLRIGAAADLAEGEIERIEWIARNWCAEQHQFRLRIGPPCLGPGGVRWCVSPWTDLDELRQGLRRATREILGLRPWLRERIPFRPHVPIAYVRGPLPAAPVQARLAALRECRPIALRIRRLSLIRITRDAGVASWYTVADMALGPRSGF
jgi:2'-5' RNA ligase